MMPVGFQDLVRRAQTGDRAAMDQVLESLRPHIEPLARRYANPTKPLESTADLLQESCLRAWNKIDTFQGGRNDEQTFGMFRAWIGQIVRRIGIDAKRDQSRQRRKADREAVRLGTPGPGDGTGGADGAPAEEPLARDRSPSTMARGNELARRIESLLEGHPDEKTATIARLYFTEGLSLTDIAKQLDLPYHQVRDRYWKLIEKLRSHLAGWL